jgi:hypothetical protein
MKRIRTACLVAALAASTFGLGGCMTVASPAMGSIWMDVKGPLDAGDRVGSKMGKACASSIAGIFATGDASIATAAANGGITQIDSVDHHSKNRVIFGEFCTIVRGS